MGGTSVKSTYVLKSSISNSKEIALSSVICSGWGFDYKASSVKSFAEYLTTQGYTVNMTQKSASGFGGEFNISINHNSKDTFIFSNNTKHKGAIISASEDVYGNRAKIKELIDEIVKVWRSI